MLNGRAILGVGRVKPLGGLYNNVADIRFFDFFLDISEECLVMLDLKGNRPVPR